MLLAFILASVGAGAGPQKADSDAAMVENPFATSSTWELMWFEEDGKRERRRGKLEILPKGRGSLKVFPRATWTILASKDGGISDGGPIDVDMDIKWEGRFPGKDTLCGIYAVRGDCLLLCFLSAGAKRPNGFFTCPGDERTLLIFRRSK